MTLIDPYDDPAASYRVIAAPNGSIALWSSFADMPDGWIPITISDDYQGCCDVIAAATAKENQR
jgi:uncharacterized protein YbdZ (MbtH family)